MGLLGDIYSVSDSLKRRFKGLLSDPIGNLVQGSEIVADDLRTQGSRNKRMIDNPESITQADVSGLLGSALNFAPIGMTVWHGSPHKFTKFDMSKIGTGEGAQAYGHGLYTAESKGVAKEYAKALGARVPAVEIGGSVSIPDKGSALEQVLNIASSSTGGINPLTHARNKIASYGKQIKNSDELLKVIDDLERQGAKVTDSQYLYKVDIPDEAVARFLDWDKPLSQQAPEVQKAIRNSPIGNRPDLDGLSGNSIHDLLMFDAQDKVAEQTGKARNGSQQNVVADYLKKNGIPGIRYLDAGSRSNGVGSSNFVLFDDALPRILEINGTSTGVNPWKQGEYGLLSQ